MAEIFGTPGDDVLDGTQGDDQIFGEEGNDTINARGGNDTINAGAGADNVNGGTGDDIYEILTSTDFTSGDSFDGGADYDTIQLTVDTDGFLLSSLSYVRVEALVVAGGGYGLGITLSQLNAFDFAQGWFRLLGSGAQTVSGVTLGTDTSFDLAPAITSFSFTAASGTTIWASGGDGGVTITGSASNDNLWSGSGNDVLNGGAGSDLLTGNAGLDQLRGGSGDDDLYGGDGADTLNGDAGDDEIFGEAGNDIILGGSGHDYLIGGDGDDTISGGSDDDYLDGGAGNDVLDGGTGTDYLIGGEGDDRLTFTGLGNAYGGSGYDRLTINLSGMTGPTDLDLLYAFSDDVPPYPQTIGGFELLTSYVGSAYDDRLNLGYLYAGSAQIDTGAGNDVVFGAGGADTIQLGDGNDFAGGGSGDDTIYGGAGNDELSGDFGADHLFGGDGDDLLYLIEYTYAAGETLDGGTGEDTLWLTMAGLGLTFADFSITGFERLVADHPFYPLAATVAQIGQFTSAQGHFSISGSGAVTLATVFGGMDGPVTNITLDPAITAFTFGSLSGTDVGVYGGDGGVTITGGTGNDGLVGGLGNDVLNGGAGSDGLVGGAGLDTLNGGDGDDWIYYTFTADGPSGLNDTIVGGAGIDTLALQSEVGADATLSLLNISGIENLSSSGVRITAAELAQFDEVAGSIRITGTGPVAVTSVHFRIANITFDETITVLDLSGATYDSEYYTYVTGGDGNNTIIGGNGRLNSILGAAGNDTIYGGTAYDAIEGGDGDDVIDGGDGGDQLYGNAGRDEIHGGNGNDGLEVGLISDLLAGEIYDGGAGTDTLYMRSNDSGSPSDLYDLTVATLISIEVLYSFPGTTKLSTAQMLSVQQLLGRFALADNAPVSLTGFTHSGLQVTLANGGQTFSLAGSSSYYPGTGATVFGGNGNDTITGGEFVGYLFGGDGDDTLIEGPTYRQNLYGGAGNDRLVLNGGGNSDGGSGYDTLVVNGSSGLFSLSNMEAIELVGGASLTLSAAQFNTGFYNAIAQIGMASVSGSGTLTFTIDPNPAGAALSLTGLSFAGGSSVSVTINGSSGIDVVKGAVAVANTITGGDGADQIRGGNQADTINGGSANDKLFGWGGVDVLTGGAGSDQFRYFFATDSGTGAAADRITDFEIGIDRFNFTLIDADPVTPGDQAFAFLGAGAFTAPGTGQIRYQNSGADLLVQVDVDGNGTVDMEVVLQGLAGSALTSADFML